MTSKTDLLNKVRQFMSDHEQTILNALAIQEREMNQASADAMAGYEQMKDLPEPDPGVTRNTDGTMTISLMPTVDGLKNMAAAFTDSAKRAEKAAEAWNKLADELEDDDAW